MAVSRGIRTIYVTNYDKSIGDVLEYIASGSGDVPMVGDPDYAIPRQAYRSDVTGVHEITIAQPPIGPLAIMVTSGSQLWGESSYDVMADDDYDISFIDYNLSAGATTITFDEDTANMLYSGVSVDYPGYLIIPEARITGVVQDPLMNPPTSEIMSYTTVDQSSPWREISGITRGVFNTTAQEHDGSVNPIMASPYFPGVVQSIEYDEEDEIYAVGVAISAAVQWKDPLPSNDYERLIESTEYRVFRFEIPKDRVDLVIYQDTEYATSISGWIGGFSPWNPE